MAFGLVAPRVATPRWSSRGCACALDCDVCWPPREARCTWWLCVESKSCLAVDLWGDAVHVLLLCMAELSDLLSESSTGPAPRQDMGERSLWTSARRRSFPNVLHTLLCYCSHLLHDMPNVAAFECRRVTRVCDVDRIVSLGSQSRGICPKRYGGSGPLDLRAVVSAQNGMEDLGECSEDAMVSHFVLLCLARRFHFLQYLDALGKRVRRTTRWFCVRVLLFICRQMTGRCTCKQMAPAGSRGSNVARSRIGRLFVSGGVGSPILVHLGTVDGSLWILLCCIRNYRYML